VQFVRFRVQRCKYLYIGANYGAIAHLPPNGFYCLGVLCVVVTL
jgi:hypothetical protein